MRVRNNDPSGAFMEIIQEEERRAKEAMACYRPAFQMPFHLATASETILRGGKRSGKSVGVATEFAARVTGRPIMGPHNKPIKLKWPTSSPKDPLLYWVIGWDIDHIGQTIYRLLFEPGLFRVILDKATGQWRTYNPASAYDVDRKGESEAAGPLIPERLIDMKSWSWENKAARNFSSLRLKNGAMICAYPSSAKHAKQGDAVSGIWIDEDIQSPGHLKEWQDRLTDKDGWFMWSVWPHSKNYALCELLDRAEEQVDDPKPDIQTFQLTMSANPYLTKEAKRKAIGRMGSEDEIARRDRGELLLDTLNMYDFYVETHAIRRIEQRDVPEKINKPMDLLRVMLTRRGRFPREWTRYLAIDPSHTRTAVSFGVIPPAEWDGVRFGDLLIIENELVVKKHSAPALAKRIKPIIEGLNYEAFIMDQQIGRQTRVGTDRTVFEIYANSFMQEKLVSRVSHSGFIPGCNVPSTRYAAVRSLMGLGEQGIPSLLLVEEKTYWHQKEFNTYRKKQLIMGGEETILDEPANPRKHDAMAALEYLCAYVGPMFTTGTAYVEPQRYGATGSPAYRRAMKILNRHKEKFDNYVHLGPGAAA